MSLTVSYILWMSPTVSTSSTELLHVSHCLFQFHVVSACVFLSLIVAGYLLLSPFSCCMSFTVSYGFFFFLTVSPVPWSFYMCHTSSHGCWLSLTLSPIPWSCFISLTVSHFCLLSLTVSMIVSPLLSLSPMIAGCLSLSFRKR